MSKSKIEWTDKSWNPLVGCSKVSQGCKNCYAMQMSARIANQGNKRVKEGDDPTPIQRAYMDTVYLDTDKMKYIPKWTGKIRTIRERLYQPIQWQKPSHIFVNSMSDLFHPMVEDIFIEQVFATMALSPQHRFQVLTKRPKRMMKMMRRMYRDQKDGRTTGPEAAAMFHFEHIDNARQKVNDAFGRRGWLKNVWVGTSVEDQEAFDERVPYLIETPAEVKFLSCEPLLGPIEMLQLASPEHDVLYFPLAGELIYESRNEPTAHMFDGIDWVIVGGESGHSARPMHPSWPKRIKEQCELADTPFFFKQWGAWAPGSDKKANGHCFALKNGEAYHTIDKNVKRKYANPQEFAKQDPQHMSKFGVKGGGNKLEGELIQEMPNG